MSILIIQQLFVEAILDLVYFPVWWYSVGLKQAFLWCLSLLERGNAMMAPGLWLKNITVPMFGQADLQGRIISFFMRLFQVIFRSLGLLIWFFVCLGLLCLWLVIPIVVIMGLVHIFVK